MRLLVATTVVLLQLCSTGHAAFLTGNEVLEACRGTDEHFCVGFVAGFYDGLTVFEHPDDRVVCPPDGVTLAQVRDLVVREIEASPEHRHRAAAPLALIALMFAFPCP